MPPSPANRVSNAGTFIAVVLLLTCALGLFLLVMMVNPFVMGVLLIPAVLVPLGVCQYLIWGPWLARLQAAEREREATLSPSLTRNHEASDARR